MSKRTSEVEVKEKGEGDGDEDKRKRRREEMGFTLARPGRRKAARREAIM